jgi:hypothetical protein
MKKYTQIQEVKILVQVLEQGMTELKEWKCGGTLCWFNGS